MQRLLMSAAVLEASTGLALIAVPTLVARLLLGDEVTGSGIAIVRIAGIALLSFGVACWPPRGQQDLINSHRTPPVLAMFVYNLLITLFLVGLGATSRSVGILLWPGAALHSVFTLLFAHGLVRRH